ncbi:MAG: YwaF family protein, partial [Clostridia bacterium]|nr:YwaF family protein [Clostridia bacterium]
MNELIWALCCVGGAFGTYLTCNALKNKNIRIGKREIVCSNLVLWSIAFLLFATMVPYMFWLNALSDKNGLSGGIFSEAGYVVLGALDWLTVMTIGVAIVMPFFTKKEARDYCATFALLVIVANVAAFRPALQANLGYLDLTHWRAIVYMVRIVLLAMLCGNAFIQLIRSRDFENFGKRILKVALFALLYLFAFMPTYYPKLLFGEIGEAAQGFTLVHRLFLYIAFVVPVVIYFAQRNQSEENRHFLLVMLALSGVIQYFTYHPHRTGASTFPLHLCNTAIVLMLVAYAFKVKSIYYFTYFINVLGAFCAIVLPETDNPALSQHTFSYWYNHWYAFFLPLLGVALDIFKRPSLKLMSSSLIVFTIYIVFVFFFNSYLNNPLFEGKYNADYFYLYS